MQSLVSFFITYELNKMQIKHSLIIAGVCIITTAGAITYSQQRLIIPTSAADHNAYLSELVLGSSTDGTESYKLDSSQQRLVVPGRLVAGNPTSNTIPSGVEYAVIGGGSYNSVDQNADNSAIGAGDGNKISAQNATIGAGRYNKINQGADGSFIGGGAQNEVSSPSTAIAGGIQNKASAHNVIIL